MIHVHREQPPRISGISKRFPHENTRDERCVIFRVGRCVYNVSRMNKSRKFTHNAIAAPTTCRTTARGHTAARRTVGLVLTMRRAMLSICSWNLSAAWAIDSKSIPDQVQQPSSRCCKGAPYISRGHRADTDGGVRLGMVQAAQGFVSICCRLFNGLRPVPDAAER